MVYAGIVSDDNVYGDYEREVRLAFRALMEVMLAGDAVGKPFAFPKPEIAIEPCFVDPDEWVQKWETEYPDMPSYEDLYRDAFELAAKFGTPYFDNMLPAYRGAGNGIACYQCCAYQFSTTEESDPYFDHKMNFTEGMHFSMGSWMVVSLNCPRAAYRAFYGNRVDDVSLVTNTIEILKLLMDKAVEVFKIKREWMKGQIINGRIPFATQRPRDPNDPDKLAPCAIDLDGYVYTIGVVGIDDMVKALEGCRMYESKAALMCGLRIITEMKEYAAELSRRHNMEIALARTPAETTAQRFAMCDLRNPSYTLPSSEVMHGDLSYANQHLQEPDLPIYYTNGTHLPPDAPISTPDRLNLESKFFPILDGGNIAHIWLGEAWTSVDGLYDFGMKIARNTQIGYFAFTRDFTVCNDCGETMSGIKEKCRRCGSDSVDFISRITGYLSNVSGWNKAKKQELMDRQRTNL